MDLKNITTFNINDKIITDVVNDYDDIKKCDKTSSLASIDVLKKYVLESIYPVGSVYINNAVNKNPKEILGFGTWVEVVDKYIYGTNGSTGEGGSDFVTVNMLPKHSHTIDITSSDAGSHTHTITRRDGWRHGSSINCIAPFDNWDIETWPAWEVSYAGEHSHTINGNTTYTGDGTDKLLPKYQSFYMWIRVEDE